MLNKLLKMGLTDKWDPECDAGLSAMGVKLYDKYKGELFGVLFSDVGGG